MGKLSWKDFEQFVWDRKSLFQADTVIGVPSLMAINEMKNGKAVVPSGVVSEIVKAAGNSVVNHWASKSVYSRKRYSSRMGT